MPVEHDPQNVAPVRHLACAKCGHGFSVTEGEQALTQKRRLQAGMRPEDPDATHKVFLEKARDLEKVTWWR